jgi:hypothetical protein
VHKSIKDEVMTIEIIKKITDRATLTVFVQNGISKLSQFICYGRLRLAD